MNRIAFFLPIVAMIAALACGLSNHYVALILITAAAEGLLYLVFFLKNSSTEYLSGYAQTLIHHFPWCERKEKTKSHTVNGKTRYETTVSYIDHSDEYFCELNTGERQEIKAEDFKRIFSKWRTQPQTIKVHHSNCVSGGGGEKFDWDGNEQNSETFTYTHRYRNPIKNSTTAMRGDKITKEMAKELGLYEYPEVKDGKQQVVLVSPDVNFNGNVSAANQELQRLNAFCGSEHQIHAFILLFPANAGTEIAMQQRDYWKGCNKNELVVCLGVNGNRVEWCETLSWMDEPTFDTEIKRYFRENNTLVLNEFVKWMRVHLDLWKRKEVKDFKNSSKYLSKGSAILLWSISLVATAIVLLCAYWIGN